MEHSWFKIIIKLNIIADLQEVYLFYFMLYLRLWNMVPLYNYYLFLYVKGMIRNINSVYKQCNGIAVVIWKNASDLNFNARLDTCIWTKY